MLSLQHQHLIVVVKLTAAALLGIFTRFPFHRKAPLSYFVAKIHKTPLPSKHLHPKNFRRGVFGRETDVLQGIVYVFLDRANRLLCGAGLVQIAREFVI